MAVFSDSYAPYVSGVVRSIQLLREELRARGHQVAVFAPAYPGTPGAARGRLAGLRSAPWPEGDGIYRFPSFPAPRYPQFRVPVPWGPRLWAVLQAFDPHVVHVHSPFVLGRVGLRAARRLGRPVCFTVHTQYDIYLRQYAGAVAPAVLPLLRRLLRRFCDTCDLVLAPTEQVRHRLRRLGTRARIEVLPGGVPVEQFAAGRREPLRSAWGVPPEGRLLAYVGRLSAEKNLGRLLDAFRSLLGQGLPVWLALVGDGPLRPALTRLAEGPLRGRLLLPGVLDYPRLADALAAADIFVFPSRSETQGLAVVEAMAAGLPVVAIRSPEVEEVLGDAALLVDDDAGALAAAVARLLAEPHLARALAERARERSRRYGVGALTERLLHHYEALVRSAPGA